jgi:hypothetical protein
MYFLPLRHSSSVEFGVSFHGVLVDFNSPQQILQSLSNSTNGSAIFNSTWNIFGRSSIARLYCASLIKNRSRTPSATKWSYILSRYVGVAIQVYVFVLPDASMLTFPEIINRILTIMYARLSPSPTAFITTCRRVWALTLFNHWIVLAALTATFYHRGMAPW